MDDAVAINMARKGFVKLLERMQDPKPRGAVDAVESVEVWAERP
jgi:predicted site-specific integrase-resolvase